MAEIAQRRLRRPLPPLNQRQRVREVDDELAVAAALTGRQHHDAGEVVELVVFLFREVSTHVKAVWSTLTKHVKVEVRQFELDVLVV